MMLARSRALLVGVARARGAAFRPADVWVGVLARDVGVFARLVLPVLDVRPFVWGRLKMGGELDRVDD